MVEVPGTLDGDGAGTLGWWPVSGTYLGTPLHPPPPAVPNGRHGARDPEQLTSDVLCCLGATIIAATRGKFEMHEFGRSTFR